MEKERYIVIENFGRYIIHDNECDKYYSLLGKDNSQNLKKLLDQQDARIKELEEALKKANINNYLTDYYLVEKENQQLKQQLSDEEKSHDLCIDHFNEECEKLRKQIKFESEAREKFKQKNQQLKQSQYQRAIEVLKAIRRYLDYKVRISKFSYNEYVDFVNLVFSSQIDILSCKQNDKRN